ncbi:adenylate/guanylate cyclase domain-containing protein [Bradyrhizobium erythrophlei]|uniref:adenylate/guanylate cyclase domain-containing protein n=1 Tax=Bradyrhizobium erythrophlei TaxID=1437360 RepID=UPI0035ED3CA7
MFAADVEGYSRLMSADEVGTLAGLTERRAILDKAIADHRGRIANTAGDSVLAEFGSAVDAVQCAVEAQAALSRSNSGLSADKHINFRIGIHVGDVIVRAGDLFGDGVNIAARLQALAQPGGVCVSGVTYDQVRKVLPIAFTDLGTQQVKNIDEPIRAFAAGRLADAPNAAARVDHPKSLPLPDKPSIAVLPFQNMSGDPEQEYFADGIAEDVLTTLSKIQELLVIARNSSFVFKGQARDIREIGRLLGARYLLEGSVRRIGNRVRLAAQLIDSRNGGHVWADRFEGDLDDVFALQDQITQDIVTALEVRLTFGEQARVWHKRSGSPLVYEHFLKGQTLYVNFAEHTHAQARSEFERALAINPAYAPALCLLGYTLIDQARFGWEGDQATAYEAALECAARDLASDPNSYLAYLTIGYARLFQRRHEDALLAGEKAVALGPSYSAAYHIAGMIHGYAGDFRKSAQYEEQAQRLSPLSLNQSMVDEARARFHLGDFVAARDIASRVLIERPRWLTAQTTLAAALWNLGREDEARLIVGKMLARHPNLTASCWAQGLPYRRQEDLDALVGPLRLAGMPD